MANPDPDTDMTPEPAGDDLPPYFHDPAYAPDSTEPPDHLEPEEDD